MTKESERPKSHLWVDIAKSEGITPDKLDQVARMENLIRSGKARYNPNEEGSGGHLHIEQTIEINNEVIGAYLTGVQHEKDTENKKR
jgi:hypothetical protein